MRWDWAILWILAAAICWAGAPGPEVAPAKEQGMIDVRATVLLTTEGRLQLRFENSGSEPLRFFLGKGIPDFHYRGGNPMSIEAGFVCPLEYEHDCFHGQIVELAPGEARTFVLEATVPQELKNRLVSRMVHVADYRTLPVRRQREPVE